MDEQNLKAVFEQMHFIEQFVETVVDYTSRYNNAFSVSYAPENITGKPTKYPCYGDFPETYMLRSYGKWWAMSEGAQKDYMPQDTDRNEVEDYIVLKFEQPVIAMRIVIYETYNPGAITKVWGGRSGGNWSLLWQGEPQKTARTSRTFSPPIKINQELIHLIRLDFNQCLLDYHTSIDAVLLAGYSAKSYLQGSIIERMCLSTNSSQKKIKQSTLLVNSSEDSVFLTLPHEVIVYIFGYLDLRSLCNCELVNRVFREASHDSLLYRQLSFKRYWNKITDQTLQQFESRCNVLRKLDLSWCGGDNLITQPGFIRFITNCGSHLTHLSLGKCGFVKQKTLECIAKCKELTDLRLRHCWQTPSDIFLVLAELSNIHSLDLYSSNVDDQSLVKIVKNNKKLEHLNIDLCEQLTELDLITETLAVNNNKLRTFSCWKTHSLTAEGIKSLAKCTDLRELDLGWCLVLIDPGDCLTYIAQGCPNLTRLILSGWRCVSDQQLLPIIRNCTKMQQLDLLGTRNITADIVDRSLKSFHDLLLLDVSFCYGLNQKQISLWRSEYPHIQIQRSCEYIAREYWNTR